jgi:hypothetical protein
LVIASSRARGTNGPFTLNNHAPKSETYSKKELAFSRASVRSHSEATDEEQDLRALARTVRNGRGKTLRIFERLGAFKARR